MIIEDVVKKMTSSRGEKNNYLIIEKERNVSLKEKFVLNISEIKFKKNKRGG
jgi:hypothetical protein